MKVFADKHQRTIEKKDGTKFEVNYQEAELLRSNKRPRVVEIPTSWNGAYDERLYTAHESGFRSYDFDRLSLTTYFRLEPLSDAITLAQNVVNFEG